MYIFLKYVIVVEYLHTKIILVFPKKKAKRKFKKEKAKESHPDSVDYTNFLHSFSIFSRTAQYIHC